MFAKRLCSGVARRKYKCHSKVRVAIMHGASGGRGSFCCGQIAKARSSRRV
jgi:hypothetical protein